MASVLDVDGVVDEARLQEIRCSLHLIHSFGIHKTDAIEDRPNTARSVGCVFQGQARICRRSLGCTHDSSVMPIGGRYSVLARC
jgi:hypothetical protein